MTLIESLSRQRRPSRTYRKVRNGKRLPLYRWAWCTLCTSTIQQGLPGGNTSTFRSLEVSYNLHPSENNTFFWSLPNYPRHGQPSLGNPACLSPRVGRKLQENNKEQVVPFKFPRGILRYYRRLGSNALSTSLDSSSVDDNHYLTGVYS